MAFVVKWLLVNKDDVMDTIFDELTAGLEEVSKTTAVYDALTEYRNRIVREGMCKSVGLGLEAISPGILNGTNLAKLSEAPSLTYANFGIEAIDWKRVGLIGVAFTALGAILIKFITWLYELVTGDRLSGGKTKSVISREYEQKAKKQIEEIQNRIKEQEPKYKNNTAQSIVDGMMPDDIISIVLCTNLAEAIENGILPDSNAEHYHLVAAAAEEVSAGVGTISEDHAYRIAMILLAIASRPTINIPAYLGLFESFDTTGQRGGNLIDSHGVYLNTILANMFDEILVLRGVANAIVSGDERTINQALMSSNRVLSNLLLEAKTGLLSYVKWLHADIPSEKGQMLSTVGVIVTPSRKIAPLIEKYVELSDVRYGMSKEYAHIAKNIPFIKAITDAKNMEKAARTRDSIVRALDKGLDMIKPSELKKYESEIQMLIENTKQIDRADVSILERVVLNNGTGMIGGALFAINRPIDALNFHRSALTNIMTILRQISLAIYNPIMGLNQYENIIATFSKRT